MEERLSLSRRSRPSVLREITVCTLSLIILVGCEWRPPRRPIAPEARTESISDAQVAELVDDLGIGAGLNADHSDHSPAAQVTKQDLFERDQVKPSLSRHYPFGHGSGETSQRPSPESSQRGVMSLSDQLYARDQMLTIDPDGPPLIHLKEVAVARGIHKRQPVSPDRVFKDQVKQLLLYLKVRNFEARQKIEIKWIHGDQVVQRDRLNIGISPRWRTWSTLDLTKIKRKTGEWRVEVEKLRDQTQLGMIYFVVER